MDNPCSLKKSNASFDRYLRKGSGTWGFIVPNGVGLAGTIPVDDHYSHNYLSNTTTMEPALGRIPRMQTSHSGPDQSPDPIAPQAAGMFDRLTGQQCGSRNNAKLV